MKANIRIEGNIVGSIWQDQLPKYESGELERFESGYKWGFFTKIKCCDTRVYRWIVQYRKNFNTIKRMKR